MKTTNLLEAEMLTRVFRYEVEGVETILDDPDPRWTAQQVLNHWAFTYPELNNARITGPHIIDDQQQYKFVSVFGTKG